ncbi:hydrolase [Streptomyces rhizosphaericus]|uniref:Hydrolase n=1 Tax=Streptomyces rhizosphaericus TaxID=114699 RepID=A0A6G4ACD5_9ACTN|nr:hydrolase [Streptomyces rhizosphaericus]MBI0378106.1 hydrolase [Streptomyces albiflaviniger]NEW70147.1 hydrolase [Streptomyces rhizosphaericus]
MTSTPHRALAVAAVAVAVALAAPAAPRASARPAACAANGFCEDFESQTGTTPAGRWTTAVANCSGTGTATVDTTMAHGGTKSVRITGKAGYCNHAFAGTSLSGLPSGGDLYARFWVRHTTALPAQHVTFGALRDANDNGKDLRMGGQNKALQWNRESDDATLPAQSPAGVALSTPLPVNTWTCLEFRLDRTAGRLDTWVNGGLVTGLVVDGTPTQDVDQQWLNRGGWRPAPADLRLGWESYGEGDDTLWYDDVAVGTSRIGC